MTLEEAKCFENKEVFHISESYPYTISMEKLTFKKEVDEEYWEFENNYGTFVSNYYVDSNYALTREEAKNKRLDIAIQELTKANEWAAKLETLVNKLTEEI